LRINNKKRHPGKGVPLLKLSGTKKACQTPPNIVKIEKKENEKKWRGERLSKTRVK
jgi:hypothetical protein